MSLRVWLPLNGTLENKGLDNITPVLTGAVAVDNEGKIGKCYKFGTSLGRITISPAIMRNYTECSVSFWVNILGWQTNWDTFFQAGLGTSPWNSYTFGVLRNQSNYVVFAISDGSTSSQGNYKSSDLTLNTWYHLGFTYKSGHCCIYVNGNLYKDYSTNIIPNFSGINYISLGQLGNASNYQTNCKLNDFRIYDHALSPLEVKQISQGLVLHYPLNRNGWGQENLLINSNVEKSGKSNTAQWFRWNITDSPLAANQYYTLSFDAKITVPTDVFYIGFAQNDSTQEVLLQGVQVISEYKRYIFTGKTTKTNINSIIISNYKNYGRGNGNNTTGTLYIKNMKLELGLKATPWCPNEADELYNKLGLNDNILYDTSGYGNNGTKVGTFDYDSDTPKYNVSTVFPSGVNWINAGRGAMIKDSVTISCWVNYSTWGNPLSCTEGGGWNFEEGNEGNGGIRTPFYISGIGYKAAQSTITSASLKNGWHMLTSLYDRINSIVKIFIDGELAGSLDTGTTNEIGYNGNNVIMIGAEAGGSATSPASTSFIGKISDVRIYCTALSAEDVKSLYNNSAYIDNQGNVYGAVYEEV